MLPRQLTPSYTEAALCNRKRRVCLKSEPNQSGLQLPLAKLLAWSTVRDRHGSASLRPQWREPGQSGFVDLIPAINLLGFDAVKASLIGTGLKCQSERSLAELLKCSLLRKGWEERQQGPQ